MSAKVLSEDNMCLEAILSPEFYSTLNETREVFISKIKNKSKISQIVDFLSKTIPLKELNHLKRIKSNNNVFEVIICLNDNRNECLTEEVNNFLSENDLLPLESRQVPKELPKTAKQFQINSKLWPISFHPNKYLEKCLNSTLFDSKTRKVIFNLILKAIELSENCDTKPSMAAIVTDSNHQIITSCVSEVKINPLRHTVLVAVDRISQLQRSGDCQQIDNKETNDIYLCTGFDFYTTFEPCLMCAMALVHSRIRRLFFLDSNINLIDFKECSDRAITLHKFHLLPKLNHHFESWKITFK